MKKAILSRLLVGMMAVALLFTACAGGASTPAANTPTTAPASTSGGTEAPAGDELVEFSVATWRGHDQVDSINQQLLEERYNVKINLVILPAPPDHQAKLALMMADPSQRPDVFLFERAWQKEFTQWRDAGLLTEISEYYFKYPNIREYSEGPWGGDTMFFAAEANGDLYRIPGDISEPGHMINMIRKDWLDHVDMDVPTTYEEFMAALYAFIDNNPTNGNPEAYAFHNSHELRSFQPWWSYYDIVGDNFRVKEDGTVVYGLLEPQVKDALADIQALYKAGGIDPNILTNGYNTTEKTAAGNWGSTYRWISSFNTQSTSFQNFKKNNPDGSFVDLTPFPNPTGTETDRGIGFEGNYYFSITAQAADKAERIYAFFDGCAAGDDYLLKKFGREGVDWAIEDGMYKTLLGPDDNTTQNIGINVFHDFVNRKDDMNIANHPDVAAMFNRGTELVARDVARNVYIKTPDRPVWNANRAELDDIRDVYIWGIIAGQRPVSDFDQFVTAWLAAGGAEATAETQALYEAQQIEFENFKNVFKAK